MSIEEVEVTSVCGVLSYSEYKSTMVLLDLHVDVSDVCGAAARNSHGSLI